MPFWFLLCDRNGSGLLGPLSLNRNCPLGGAKHLFERWRQLCGHFVRLFGVHSQAMNASQPYILPRKAARHHLKP